MPVELTRVEEFALLTLNRPEALNALSFAIIAEIGLKLDEVARSDARALLITGAGAKSFCAGADIKELQGRDLMAQKRGAELGQHTFAKLDRLPMPSVALINGFAFGGGLELAMACTFRLASANAKMGQPEIKLGLIPGYGGTQRLPRLIGEARAMELILTGRAIDAAEAERIGLVERVVPHDTLLDEVMALAGQIASNPYLSVRYAKELVKMYWNANRSEEGWKRELESIMEITRTKDCQEGIRAFLGKRKADYRGPYYQNWPFGGADGD